MVSREACIRPVMYVLLVLFILISIHEIYSVFVFFRLIPLSPLDECRALDASNAVMPLVFFLAPNDPKFQDTLFQMLKRPKEGNTLYLRSPIYDSLHIPSFS